MYEIKYKPLSVNEVWKGKRFKTKAYNDYEMALFLILPPKRAVIIPDWPFEIVFYFGFSSPLADWDNPIKPLQDILAKKYGFNDKFIFKGSGEKEIVPKWQEYIAFEIIPYVKKKR